MKRAVQTAMLVLALFCLSRTTFAQNAGADTFKGKCAGCHGADGLAATPMAKPLGVISYKDPAVLKMKDADLVAIIKNGKNKMPAFNGKLTDAQVQDVLKYIRTLQK